MRARVTELQRTLTQTSVTRAALSRKFVLTELMDNALKAKQNQEWPASELHLSSNGGYTLLLALREPFQSGGYRHNGVTWVVTVTGLI